jgi:predicted enzyme related to lactoylglutathione lyase
LDTSPPYFTWYELMTTDVAAATAFYREVVGWGTEQAAASKLPYTLFTTGEGPAAGLLELPEEGRRMGARPIWTGYVAVRDLHAKVAQLRRLGGAVYVPPTESNIGLISVVADPDTASFALIERPRMRTQQSTEAGKIGRVGWHELLAADLGKGFEFYRKLFDWRDADGEAGAGASYRAFSADGLVVGGASRKRPDDPAPGWLFYFNVEDLDAAVERLGACGGKAFPAEGEVPGGLSVAHCFDPQGAAFALRGKRTRTRKLGWSAEWEGFSSQGQLLAPKPGRGSSGNS